MKSILLVACFVAGSLVSGVTSAAESENSSEFLQVASLPDGGALVFGTWRGIFAGEDAGPGTAAFVRYVDESGDVVWTERLALDLSCLRVESFDVTTRAERVRSRGGAYFLVWTCDGPQLVSANAAGVIAERSAGPDGGSFGVSTFAADPTGGVQLVARGAAFDPSGQNPWTLFSYDEALEIRFAAELSNELIDPRQIGVDEDGAFGDSGTDAPTVTNLVAQDGTGWVAGTVPGDDGIGTLVLISFDATGAEVSRVEHPGYGCLREFDVSEPQMRALQTYGDQLWVAACESADLDDEMMLPFPILAFDDTSGALLGEVAPPEDDVNAPRFTSYYSPARFSGDGTLALTSGQRGEVLWMISGELGRTAWEPVTVSVSGNSDSDSLVSVDSFGSTGYIAAGSTAGPDVGPEFAPRARNADLVRREFPSLRAVDPARVLDTRLDPDAGPRRAGSVTEIDVESVGSFPPDAQAVIVNLTVIRPTSNGFATVFPCGGERPNVSSVNFVGGRTASNAVTSAIGESGQVCVFTSSNAHLAVDVNAVFVDTPSFGAIEPARLVDTRSVEPVGSGEVLRVQVTGNAGIDDGAAQVVVNATAVRPSARGYLTVWDCSDDRPGIGSVNFERNETTPNQAIVALGEGGEVCVFASAETHVLIDATAWLGPNAGMRLGEPVRALDTRPTGVTFDGRAAGSNGSAGRLAGDETWVLALSRLPVGRFDRVMSLNVAVVNPATAGHLTMWPCGSNGFAPVAPPTVSSVNYLPGRATSNSVMIEIPSTPHICFRSTADYDLILDLMTSR